MNRKVGRIVGPAAVAAILVMAFVLPAAAQDEPPPSEWGLDLNQALTLVKQMVVTTIALAIVNKSIMDWLTAPLKKKFPDFDWWWLVYVSGVTGFLIGWFAEVNLLLGVVPSNTLGRIITSILVGGGSSLIYDIVHALEKIVVAKQQNG